MIRARHDGDFPALAEIVRLVHAAEGYPVNLPDSPSDWLIGDHQAGACHAAIRLYQRLGWVETGSEPIDWGGALASQVIQFRPSTPAGVNNV